MRDASDPDNNKYYKLYMCVCVDLLRNERLKPKNIIYNSNVINKFFCFGLRIAQRSRGVGNLRIKKRSFQVVLLL